MDLLKQSVALDVSKDQLDGPADKRAFGSMLCSHWYNTESKSEVNAQVC